MDNTAPAGQASEPPTVTITRDQIECWVGRSLTDDEIAQLDDCIPNSSIPDAIADIASQFEHDEEGFNLTDCQLCGAPGGYPYCAGRFGRTASCAEVVELDSASAENP